MPLRPYQLDAIDRVRHSMHGGARLVLLVAPTGSGKTTMGAEIVRCTVAAGRRALWLAPRVELVDQAADTLTRAGMTVGAACATASTPPNPFASVQVASVQTLLARKLRPPADMVIIDEAHHASADEQKALLAHYETALGVGLTATPERGDGRGLDLFDGLVVGATVRELVDAGHLVPCEILRPDSVLGPGEIAQSPVDAYLEHAVGRRTVVFARTIELAEQYTAEFTARGIRAATVSIRTPWSERRMIVDALRRGGIDVVCNVAVLTEGFDAPEIACIIIARGCGSAGLYLQMIGRGLRPAASKRDCLLLDLRGVSHEHGRPEDERTYSLDGKGISLRDPNSYCGRCGAPRTPPDPCDSCGFAPSRDEGGKPDTVTGDKLTRFAKLREGDDDVKRAERLGRWLLQARERGYKEGWAYAKFAAVYGGSAPRAVRDRALERARGAA